MQLVDYIRGLLSFGSFAKEHDFWPNFAKIAQVPSISREVTDLYRSRGCTHPVTCAIEASQYVTCNNELLSKSFLAELTAMIYLQHIILNIKKHYGCEIEDFVGTHLCKLTYLWISFSSTRIPTKKGRIAVLLTFKGDWCA